MATTKLYLDCRGKAKDGKGSVIINITHNQTMTSIPTGIRVPKECWYKERVVNYPGDVALNAKLGKQKSDIDTELAVLSLEDNFDKMTAAQLKGLIMSGKIKKQKFHYVTDVFREYLQTGIEEGTKEIYKTTLRKILDFAGTKVTMEQIDLKWLHQFDNHLAGTLSANSRSIYLRSLRAICNYAEHTELVDTYAFKNFSIKQEPTPKRSVSVEILRKFKDYPTNRLNSTHRDYFFLMFYLIGINIKDLVLAKKEQIVDGRLEYTRAKTHKKYSIKIEPEAEELLDKYKGNNWLIDPMDRYADYKCFRHNLNACLKMIGPEKEKTDSVLFPDTEPVKTIEPIIPGISTYFARHTWATFAHELGISSDVIALALGHSLPNRITFIYINPDQDKVDEANRKVIDYFLGKISI